MALAVVAGLATLGASTQEPEDYCGFMLINTTPLELEISLAHGDFVKTYEALDEHVLSEEFWETKLPCDGAPTFVIGIEPVLFPGGGTAKQFDLPPEGQTVIWCIGERCDEIDPPGGRPAAKPGRIT